MASSIEESRTEQPNDINNNEESESSCPFSKALKEPSSSPLLTSLPGFIEVKACPAFNQGECPFKGAKSPEELTERLQRLPPSHLEANGGFYKTLEYFHHTQQNQSQQQHYGSQIGCPVKHALPVQDWTFDQAMEEYSLAAVMGRLAEEWEAKHTDAPASAVTKSTSSVSSTSSSSSSEELRLSDALKSGTALAHEAAESVHFVKNFVRGKIDRDLYGLLVAQLYHVYRKLEALLDQHAPQHFGSCHFPKELHRSSALQEDVDFWHTTSFPPVSPATQDYLDRLDHLGKTNPLLLLAHAYTRYLGDLSGGKVLARVARRALQLEDEGLAFYQFPEVKSFKLFKDHYRGCLNDLKISKDQIQQLVEEANVAFLLNMRLFEELDVLGGVLGACIRSLEDVFSMPKPSHAMLQTEDYASDGKNAPCPFASTASLLPPKKSAAGTCPWPFILLHDPKTGMKAWQTWLVIGLILIYLYSTVFANFATNSTVTKTLPLHANVISSKKTNVLFSPEQIYDHWKLET